MCNTTHHFILCSCLEKNDDLVKHNKNSRRAKKEFEENNPDKLVWTLYKYEGQAWIGMDGMMVPPAAKLRDEFTAESVLMELNSRNCFDFEYQPNEGDYLALRNDTIMSKRANVDDKYLPFIFTNGAWTINYYNTFYEKTVEIDGGVIRNS